MRVGRTMVLTMDRDIDIPVDGLVLKGEVFQRGSGGACGVLPSQGALREGSAGRAQAARAVQLCS